MEFSETTKYWLWLEMVFGVASVKLMELVQMYDSLKELYYALHDPDCSLLNEKERKRVKTTALSQCEGVMAYCEKNGIGIMTWDSALYPESLRHIYNPPAVLFYKGNPLLLQQDMLLTVVGTRHPSNYSMRVSRWLCTDLAKCNIILVSGCAVGLDASAHNAAIAEGKPTIAVLGCGIDYDYPRENRAMKEKIVENGLLLTEYFPGTPPHGKNFPIRNRILSGISGAVLVLEAGAKSGALITANLACEQEKYVFCVPPADLFDPRYSGVAGFLRDGAYPVFNYLDILYVYYMKYPHKITLFDEEHVSRTVDSLLFSADTPETRSPRSPKHTVKKPESSRMPTASQIPAAAPKPSAMSESLTPVQQKLLRIIGEGGNTMNSICIKAGLSFEETSMQVMELQMLGYVDNTERDMFALVEKQTGAV